MLAVKISCFSDFRVSFLLLHNVSLTISQLINKLLKKYLVVWVLSVVGGGPLSLLSVSHTLIMYTLNYTKTSLVYALVSCLRTLSLLCYQVL